jgi:hypothetical protein
VFLKTEIGLNLKNTETELLLFTMLVTKPFLDQLIDSLPMIPIPTKRMSINLSPKNGILSKDTGIISTSVILTMNKLPLVT